MSITDQANTDSNHDSNSHTIKNILSPHFWLVAVSPVLAFIFAVAIMMLLFLFLGSASWNGSLLNQFMSQFKNPFISILIFDLLGFCVLILSIFALVAPALVSYFINLKYPFSVSWGQAMLTASIYFVFQIVLLFFIGYRSWLNMLSSQMIQGLQIMQDLPAPAYSIIMYNPWLKYIMCLGFLELVIMPLSIAFFGRLGARSSLAHS